MVKETTELASEITIDSIVQFLYIIFNVKDIYYNINTYHKEEPSYKSIILWNLPYVDIILYNIAKKYKAELYILDCQLKDSVRQLDIFSDKKRRYKFNTLEITKFLTQNETNKRKILLIKNYEKKYLKEYFQNNRKDIDKDEACERIENFVIKMLYDKEIFYNNKIDNNVNMCLSISKNTEISNLLFLETANTFLHYEHDNDKVVFNHLLQAINQDYQNILSLQYNYNNSEIKEQIYDLVFEFKKQNMTHYYEKIIDNKIPRRFYGYDCIIMNTSSWNYITEIFMLCIMAKITDINVYKLLLIGIGGKYLWDNTNIKSVVQNVISNYIL